ncbi:MAG: hypothetical protein NTV48_03555 [Candidatus Vogelbacteria bacterium]|nr:hypothetical protein [Candidatus Vogelbacteria bacterium]
MILPSEMVFGAKPRGTTSARPNETATVTRQDRGQEGETCPHNKQARIFRSRKGAVDCVACTLRMCCKVYAQDGCLIMKKPTPVPTVPKLIPVTAMTRASQQPCRHDTGRTPIMVRPNDQFVGCTHINPQTKKPWDPANPTCSVLASQVKCPYLAG